MKIKDNAIGGKLPEEMSYSSIKDIEYKILNTYLQNYTQISYTYLELCTE